MSWAQNIPVQRMLMLVIVSTCTVVLLVACAMLGGYQMIESRTSLVRDITILADVAGRNTQAALAFQDEAAARETLMALQTAGDVQAARLYAADGAPFADYVRTATEVALPSRPVADGENFTGNHLTVTRSVTLDGKRIGTILLQASLAGRNARLLLFATIAAIVLFASLGVGVIVSSRLQRSVSGPIQRLATTARGIAANKDYKVRAESSGTNETGQLTEAFNQVLTGIEERENALKDANSALRAEVIERQRVDVVVHKQLGRLELLHQITRAIGERQDLQSIFPVVIGRLEDHLPIDFGCVCLYDESKNLLSVSSVGPRSGELAHQVGFDLEDLSFDTAGRELEDFVSGELHYEPDLSASQTPLLKKLAAAGLGSLVIAPLPVAGQLFGILVTARRRLRGFESAECEFLKQLSEHVAVAAHQLQLHGSLQQAYDDLRHTQQAVMQQERLRALGQMASGIAHDINNALSPVSLYTESLLEQEKGLSPRAQGQLKTIQRAIDDVAQTVARMREFYRQRETQIQLAPVNVNDLLQQVIDLSRARWNDMPLQRGIVVTMRTDLAPETPLIMAVESEIREALVNLIFNAVDAMPEGGTLTLRTRVVGSRVRAENNGDSHRVHIEVSDTGVGMSEEVRKRCLEPFYTTKGERGTGLGLAMVYGVVERHSSELEIDSQVGHGTTIRMSFAVPEAMVASGADTTQMNIILPSLRILVVDDDPLVLKSLRDALEGDSHQVTTANGGEAGIEIFRSHCLRGETFAIVITDLGMPYIDGRKVASAVKEASPVTPVILLTGWGQRLIAEGDVPAGVDRVLNKPPRLRELRAALAKCVKHTSFPDSTYRTA
jgi:signal transduction histidine kinase/ActR/RegA family two-component response regulator